MKTKEEIEILRKRIDRTKDQYEKFKSRKVKNKPLIKDNTKKKVKKRPKKIRYKTKKEYHKELKDKRWLKKRDKILKLDNYKCRHCGSSNNLTVHHKTYINNRKAWQYPNELLITLCKSCHHTEHMIPITTLI
jgi:5-methylcytosine-specific restriction endonuclease McrA